MSHADLASDGCGFCCAWLAWGCQRLMGGVAGLLRRRQMEEDGCTICHGSMTGDETVRTLACNHSFHQACIDDYTRCPICRQHAGPLVDLPAGPSAPIPIPGPHGRQPRVVQNISIPPRLLLSPQSTSSWP